jgi:hypothetical protein
MIEKVSIESMLESETLQSAKQNFLSTQSSQEDNTQFTSIEINERTFFAQALELIQILPISFQDEPYELSIFKFIQISVKFWKKVIPLPQNEETKYSIQILDERSNDFANIINRQSNQDNSNEHLPHSNDNFQNSNSLEEPVVSLISECFCKLFPPQKNQTHSLP